MNETHTSMRALDGIRVLELNAPFGLYCTKLFADLGADVIKVEPQLGDPSRRSAPLYESDDGAMCSASFAFFNTSKRSITLDLETFEGRELLIRLAQTADLVVEGFEPGHLERMDLGYTRLSEVNPTIVMTSITPYGKWGPKAHLPGNDLLSQAAGGLLYLSGYRDGSPVRIGGDQVLYIASLYAAVASAIGVLSAKRTGQGHEIDVSVQEAVAHSLQNAVQVYDFEGRVPAREGTDGGDASYGAFPCKDGLVALSVRPTLGRSWQPLVEWMVTEQIPGAEALREPRWLDEKWRKSQRAKEEFRSVFVPFCSTKTRRELMTEALKHRMLIAPVNSIEDAMLDEQLSYRSFYANLFHPELGREVVYPGAPYRMSRTPWEMRRLAPNLGQDNAAVFLELLGLEHQEYEALVNNGII